jgi:hypothetical protein
MRYLKGLLLLAALLPLQPLLAQDVTIPMGVMTGLQFDVVRFRVPPGAHVKIVFTNTDDMNHNLLIVKPGMREQVVNEALQLGEKGPEADYIPASSNVLWALPVVAPEQVKTLEFTAPQTPNIYPFVCTYPGHGTVMYGAMYVTADTALPDLATDMNIPPQRRQDDISLEEKEVDHSGHHGHDMATLHPYETKAPYLYRVFIEGASPAAIAVCLPMQLAYCWDASACKLRFAWHGGFLDNSDLWKGKGDALAKVVGMKFFQDSTGYPLGGPGAKVRYKGYRLVNRFPEFHYTVNGLHVYEMIRPKEDGSGIVRSFRIPGNTKPLVFHGGDNGQVQLESSAGTWAGSSLQLSAAQAKAFSIIMTIKAH